MRSESFHIGLIYWKDFEQILPAVPEFSKVLNDNINLKKHGNGLEEIVFVPICLKPSNSIHKEKFKYNGIKKKLDLFLKLDYQRLKNASEHEFLQMVADLFLLSIDRFKQHRVKNFDIPAFKEDVQKVFRERNWIS